jgi:N utilization substance protein A
MLDLRSTNALLDPEEAVLTTATVLAVGKDLTSVSLHGGVEGVLPRTAIPAGRELAAGDLLLVEVLRPSSRPVVSAVSPSIVAKQLEAYVPELRDGSVRVMAVAREAGVRSKVAVAATVPGVDPIAAVLGRASNRIKALARSLGGERIDIVAWNPDAKIFVRNALGPVGVQDVRDTEEGLAVVVPSHLTHAAIGGGAMNVRLTAALVGRRISIIQEG